MRNIISVFSNDDKIQRQERLSSFDLIAVNRIFSLFFDKIYVPFSFVLRSPRTLFTMSEELPLIEKGIIFFGHDSRYNTIDEFLDNYLEKNKEKVSEQLELGRIDKLLASTRAVDFYKYDIYKIGTNSKEILFEVLYKNLDRKIYDKLRIEYPFDILNREWLIAWSDRNNLSIDSKKLIFQAANFAYINSHVNYYKWNVEIPAQLLQLQCEHQPIVESYGETRTRFNLDDVLNFTQEIFEIDPAGIVHLNFDEFFGLRNDMFFRRVRANLKRFFTNYEDFKKELYEIIAVTLPAIEDWKSSQVLRTLPRFVDKLINYGRMYPELATEVAFLNRYKKQLISETKTAGIVREKSRYSPIIRTHQGKKETVKSSSYVDKKGSGREFIERETKEKIRRMIKLLIE